jgi:hypothetical protein
MQDESGLEGNLSKNGIGGRVRMYRLMGVMMGGPMVLALSALQV